MELSTNTIVNIKTGTSRKELVITRTNKNQGFTIEDIQRIYDNTVKTIGNNRVNVMVATTITDKYHTLKAMNAETIDLRDEASYFEGKVHDPTNFLKYYKIIFSYW